MKQILEAFTIFSKYTNDEYVTHCEHDEMYVMVDPEKVSVPDKERLKELGFREYADGGFISTKFGSC